MRIIINKVLLNLLILCAFSGFVNKTFAQTTSAPNLIAVCTSSELTYLAEGQSQAVIINGASTTITYSNEVGFSSSSYTYNECGINVPAGNWISAGVKPVTVIAILLSTGLFSLSVNGSGMTLANGITSVSTTHTDIQTLHTQLNYDGTAFGTLNFTVGMPVAVAPI